ncbi:unnamed protein product [Pseudo-nitzschia multistriata]|uniref:Uncharacterized protein n=1 Tax=Pseudo-nitzschia multistriata TaxID=183589 RepID=A0A448ZLH8_9STRA|nr:unnamed protein product [Pseudo-nitzschia multistriata]
MDGRPNPLLLFPLALVCLRSPLGRFYPSASFLLPIGFFALPCLALPCSAYRRRLRRTEAGRMRMLSMSQAASSSSGPDPLRIKLTEMQSDGARPVCSRAVKKPFLPSKEYSPFSIVCCLALPCPAPPIADACGGPRRGG